MRRLSRLLGPFLVLAYIVPWSFGVYVAVCIDFPPAVRWGAVIALLVSIIFFVWSRRRMPWPDGWYRPSRGYIVFVAILCLLATLPAVLSGCHRGVNVSYCGYRGQQVVLVIRALLARHASDDDTIGMQPPPLWPETNTWRNANAYFASLVRLTASDEYHVIPWDLVLCSGLKPARSPEALKNGGGCAWACLAGIGDCDSDDTPFLWTANLRVGPEDFSGADPAHPKNWKERVDSHLLRGLRGWVVVIRKDGSMSQAPAYAITDAWFLGSSSNAPARIEALYPLLPSPAP